MIGRVLRRIFQILRRWWVNMKYPAMPGGKSYRVTVPKLDGGVNLHDGVTQVEDNQLTDCRNMWWKDGMLRTRPGVSFGAGDVSQVYDDKIYAYKLLPGPHDTAFSVIQGSSHSSASDEIRPRMSVSPLQYDPVTGRVRYGTTYALSSDRIFNLMLVPSVHLKINSVVYNKLLFQHEAGYTSAIYAQTSDISSNWTSVASQHFYEPIVFVGGAPLTFPDEEKANGIPFEGYNLLTNRFRCFFTSNGEGTYYALGQPIAKTTLTVTFTTAEGTGTASFTNYPSGWAIKSVTIGEIAYTVLAFSDAGRVQILRTSNSGPLPAINMANNVIISAEARPSSPAVQADSITGDDIYRMTFNTWFGGDRSGYGGGTRLFMGGNPDRPNLVCWSDVNNPLYFPENNYAYIGDASSAVTAFGRQSEKLVIFKENELYYAVYVAGQAYTVEDVTEGRVTDVAAVSAKFPITPLHAAVGCDCPDTIQLCNNRLVWAHSNRHVYVLTSANQYSESNVADLSRNIFPRLREYSADTMRNSVAYEYDGHYLLHVGDKAYLFDYQDNAFTYYANFETSRKAESKIPWYVWDFSGLGASAIGFLDFTDDRFVVLYRSEVKVTDSGGVGPPTRQWFNYRIPARLEGIVDNTFLLSSDYAAYTTGERPISCMVQTKMFDFGGPERFKDIRQMYIGVSNDAEYDIDVVYLTDRGEFTDAALRPADVTVAHGGAARNVVRRLSPGLRRVLRFGLRLVSEGAIAVGDLVLKYTVNGGNTRG